MTNATTRIAVMGSTGSIGRSTLDVIHASGGRMATWAISAFRRLDDVVAQAKRWRPRWVVAANASVAQQYDWSQLPAGTELLTGPEGLEQIARAEEVDTLVAAIVGSAGVRSTLAALEAGKRVALANKESLVVAGPIVRDLLSRYGGEILPVDSEHSAIFQALGAGRRQDVCRVLLTASGGPFREWTAAELENVTLEQALAHPTWEMGTKVTIDSATMMNKALEIIEARWLFDLQPEQIDVVIHPQSYVHSMVEYVDGSIVSQMSPPDMRLPIQYALTYPKRVPSPARKSDFSQHQRLDFFPPDHHRFPAIGLGLEVAKAGGTAGAVMNAANEAAVQRFIDGQLKFTEIVPACRAALEQHHFDPHPTLDELFRLDRWAQEGGFPVGVYLIADSWWLDLGNLLSLAKAIFGLGIVIFVHELGHFLVAKACGVKCEKFYVGFDVPMSIGPIRLPAKLWHRQWGETEYGLGLIPLGGYVKMLGQDDNPANASAEAERIRKMKADPDGSSDYELDPRSYPAKSVPQRMAIISAGVITNLIFAVIFGAAAYWMGVKYEPAICGQTVPGDSAWKNGLGFGDKIVQFSREGRRDEFYRFRDVRYHIGQAHDERTLDVRIEHPDESENWVTLQSVIHDGENLDLPTIGFIGQSSTKLVKRPFDDWSLVATSGLLDGDVIQRVKVDDRTFEIDNEFDLRKVQLAYRDRPLTLFVERTAGESTSELEVTLPARRRREFGFRLEMGPVVATQQGSPAAAAGIQPGDVLIAVAGQKIEDPLRVDDMLRPYQDQSVAITVSRQGQQQDIELTPRTPTMTGDAFGMGRATSAESIGAAYAVQDVIAAIVPGGPAESAGLKPGDRLQSVAVVHTDQSPISAEKFRQLELHKPIDFEVQQNGWAGLIPGIERTMPPGLDFALKAERNGQEVTALVTPVDAADQYDVDRGLWFHPKSLTRTADSLSDAWRLGLRETKESAEQVLVTLKRLPKLYKHMGGPFSMAYVATMEASEGLPRLLLFLTFLSANLAVLNFMPIPVLDGGHMMFLLYEGVFGRPLPERFAFLATMVGVCFVLGLMAYVIGLDVYRLVGLAG